MRFGDLKEWLRFEVVDIYFCIIFVMRFRIQSLTQIGRELTEIKAFEVVEIWRFEVVGLVEICFDIMYFVRIGPKM